MAADLHIHVLDGCTEQDLAAFNSNTIGSKWGPPEDFDSPDWNERFTAHAGKASKAKSEEVWQRISDSPNIWIGSVSYLKAALTGDGEKYVPNAVGQISELIAEDLPVIDDDLSKKIVAALEVPNQADSYYNTRDAQDPELIEFLRKHAGKKIFTVAW